MAGEIIRTTAVCLDIRPWSRTSHIVVWLTPMGKVTTVVKGAQRPKSAFLGQYDLNYTCEILYYARAHAELHALKECWIVNLREKLRANYRALVLAGYFRELVQRLVPQGPEAAAWYEVLGEGLGGLEGLEGLEGLAGMLAFELKVLHLLGLDPEVEAENGAFFLRGERQLAISREVARALKNPFGVADDTILLDAARVIGVYYDFHVDIAAQTRRGVLRILQTKTR